MKLSKEETSAIRSLKRLAKRWPKSLMLFGCDDKLYVLRSDVYLRGEKQEVLATIDGIFHDSGTGNDTFIQKRLADKQET